MSTLIRYHLPVQHYCAYLFTAVWGFLCEESKRSYGIPEEEPISEAIEFCEKKDSKGSSALEDNPDQEIIAQMKLVESTEEAAGHASNNEND
ncbi:hypothetical protein TNIN_76971 [Trichonephila inaurata madagascariensis]|uniref:Uncharacterized protein n=1 Tax=Trichonephila inaurata madagascariensis TaxID=2747483 RepID=A0A8X6WSB8_9ARAC|nr:hypothetical protein TNIN_76971 [Trichonephila inaurata madagascariensis]